MPKVFVAGIAGFLGSHVAELFRCKGWEVSGIDNLTKFELSRTGYNVEKARAYNTNFLKSIGAELIVGDIRDYNEVDAVATKCDYIVNCAAQPAMTVALEEPYYDASVNIMGTLNLLEAGRKYGIPVALCSTIHVYGNGINERLCPTYGRYHDNPKSKLIPIEGKQCFDETTETLTGDITPLHVSKKTTEDYARAFIASYNSKVFVSRLTGIYGERQVGTIDHGWISVFTIQTLLNLPITVYYTDKQVRDILYVKDAAQAFIDWYEKGQDKPGIYNICGGYPARTSIRDCLNILSEITGKKQDITITKEPRRGDLWYFVGDDSKARLAFGWKPTVLPKDGLPKLVKWVEENKELFDCTQTP